MPATAILPVKRFSRSMTRLGDAIDARERAQLMRAMLGDVLRALDDAESVERIIVVSGEKRAEQVAMEAAKRLRTPIEVLRDPDDEGHSEAAVLGIIRALALGATTSALVPGDCPLLAGSELDGAISAMSDGEVVVVPDREGSGTNALLMRPADAIGPAFGPGSHARHLDRAERAGYAARTLELPSLALDLDAPEDLAALRDRAADAAFADSATAAALREIPAR